MLAPSKKIIVISTILLAAGYLIFNFSSITVRAQLWYAPDLRIGFQTREGTGFGGTSFITNWFSQGSNATQWGGRANPTGLRIFLDQREFGDLSGLDYRIGFQLGDNDSQCISPSGNTPSTIFTPWASEYTVSNGGWSNWAGDGDNLDFNCYKLFVETRPKTSGQPISNVRFKGQLGDGDNQATAACDPSRTGGVGYTPWADTISGGFSQWMNAGDDTLLPDCFRLGMEVDFVLAPPPPEVDLKANNSDNPLPIEYNTSALLSWTAQNALSCIASDGWSGSKSVPSGQETTNNLFSTTKFTLTCSGATGTTPASDSVFVNVEPPPTPSVDIKANGLDINVSIPHNSAAMLSWTSENVSSCTASGDWSGSKALSGSESTGNLTSSKTYNLSCDGPGGPATDSVTVSVEPPPPAVDIKANGSDTPPPIPYGSSATLSWTSTNVGSCVASGAWSGSRPASGQEQTDNLGAGSYTYTLKCADPTGSISRLDSVVVSVENAPFDEGQGIIRVRGANPGTYNIPVNIRGIDSNTGSLINVETVTVTLTVSAPPPTADIKARFGSGAPVDGPITIPYDNRVTVSWSSTNASSCSVSPTDWSGTQNNGQPSERLTSDTTFNLSCSGPGGTASDSVFIDVLPELVCSPNFLSIESGDPGTFSGQGGLAPYSWSASSDCSPATTTGSSFTTTCTDEGDHPITLRDSFNPASTDGCILHVTCSNDAPVIQPLQCFLADNGEPSPDCISGGNRKGLVIRAEINDPDPRPDPSCIWEILKDGDVIATYSPLCVADPSVAGRYSSSILWSTLGNYTARFTFNDNWTCNNTDTKEQRFIVLSFYQEVQRHPLFRAVTQIFQGAYGFIARLLR